MRGTDGDREKGKKIPARSSSLLLRYVVSFALLQSKHTGSDSSNATTQGLCSFIKFLLHY